jgi:hypothetical protein
MPGTATNEKSQTTPIVTGTDVFAFGPTDTVGPGEKDGKPAAAPPAGEDPPAPAPPDKPAAAPAERKEDKPPARFKDHAAAEEGYKNLQAKSTRAEQEAAELRRTVAEYKEREAGSSKLEAGKKEEAAEAEIEKAIHAYTKKQNAAALKAIEELDPDDPEHRDKVADLWARFYTSVQKFARKPVDAEGKPLRAETHPVEPAVKKETPPAAPPAEPAAPASTEERRKQTRDYIDERARTAGIDDPGNDPLWTGVALQTPAQDEAGNKLSLDQQIDWTVKKYNEKMAAIKARVHQQTNTPLDRGGNPPAGGSREPDVPMSLGDAVERSKERRRL